MTQSDPRLHQNPPFVDFLGIRLVSSSPEKIVAEMRVSDAHLNRNGVLHGGAVMALADFAGGVMALVQLDDSEGTTTMESKTNFFRSVPAGDIARAESVVLHHGRKTTVSQTSIYRGDGKLCAQIVQTQMRIPMKT